MTYKPIFRPDLVEMGCAGGFCEPPKSAIDELKEVSRQMFKEIAEETGVEEKLLTAFIGILEEAKGKIDPEIIDTYSLKDIIGEELEYIFVDMECNITNHAYRIIEGY